MNEGTFAFLVSAALFSFTASDLRAQSYQAVLDGATEGTASPATGFATVDFNLTTHMMHVTATFSGLTGNTIGADIHAGTGIPFGGTVGGSTASFTGFPLGVTSGSFENTYNMSLAGSFNGGYLAGHNNSPAEAEAHLLEEAIEGEEYFSIQTTSYPGGEIRGYFVPVPESSRIGLIFAGAVAAFSVFRRVTGKKFIG